MAALSPVIGYDKASAIARNASPESTTLRQAALTATESAGRARRAETVAAAEALVHRPFAPRRTTENE
jgi:fumarate hydratase class II